MKDHVINNVKMNIFEIGLITNVITGNLDISQRTDVDDTKYDRVGKNACPIALNCEIIYPLTTKYTRDCFLRVLDVFWINLEARIFERFNKELSRARFIFVQPTTTTNMKKKNSANL